MRWLLAGSILFAVVSAFAGGPDRYFDDKYQEELLARVLPEGERSACTAKKAANNSGCKVTRLYLLDISAGKDKGHGYPRLADGEYCKTNDEIDLLLERLPPLK